MDIAVIFTDNNARIIKNPPNLEYLKTLDNVLINPDMSGVVGIPPHLWAKEGDSIRVLTEEETIERHKSHVQHGIINEPVKAPVVEQIIVEHVVPQTFAKNKIYQALVAGLLLGICLGAAFEAIFRRF